MSTRIVIQNGRLLDPANKLDRVAHLYIEQGVIVGIDKTPANFKADHIIDANKQWVIPGVVDLAARLREPGAEYKTTIATETRAAANAGITTLCLPPDTDPVIDEPAVVELIQQRALSAGGAKLQTLGALTVGLKGEQLSEMLALKQAGCLGVSNAFKPLSNNRVLRRAFEYAATFDLTVHISPMDLALSADGVAHDGYIAAQLGLMGIPVSAETSALAQCLILIEEVGVKAHFGRLSAARSVEMIAVAKQRGLNITADVAAHQLLLNDSAIAHFDARAHVLPPLRDETDRLGLLAGIRNGSIDAICSDHQPHESDAKANPFPMTAPGISALETLLPLCLKLVATQQLDLSTVLTCLTRKPAEILGLSVGQLAVNTPADIAIINPNANWTLNSAQMISRGHNTPFDGWAFNHQVQLTLVNGKIIERDL
ncbi:MAG: dihydroorotase [Gammaproteobacteria bacterium]|nr:dihydroorotase [Gammaproteobacteria bacterium]